MGILGIFPNSHFKCCSFFLLPFGPSVAEGRGKREALVSPLHFLFTSYSGDSDLLALVWQLRPCCLDSSCIEEEVFGWLPMEYLTDNICVAFHKAPLPMLLNLNSTIMLVRIYVHAQLFSRVWLCDSMDCRAPLSAKLLCPCYFTGKNTGMSCHYLLQGISPTKGSNPRLLHLLHLPLSHLGSPSEKIAFFKFHTQWNPNMLSDLFKVTANILESRTQTQLFQFQCFILIYNTAFVPMFHRLGNTS